MYYFREDGKKNEIKSIHEIQFTRVVYESFNLIWRDCDILRLKFSFHDIYIYIYVSSLIRIAIWLQKYFRFNYGKKSIYVGVHIYLPNDIINGVCCTYWTKLAHGIRASWNFNEIYNDHYLLLAMIMYYQRHINKVSRNNKKKRERERNTSWVLKLHDFLNLNPKTFKITIPIQNFYLCDLLKSSL